MRVRELVGGVSLGWVALTFCGACALEGGETGDGADEGNDETLETETGGSLGEGATESSGGSTSVDEGPSASGGSSTTGSGGIDGGGGFFDGTGGAMSDPDPDPDPNPGPADLYTQIGTDPSWEEVLESGQLPIGSNSTTGYTGSTIDVNNDLVEQGPYADTPIPTEIKIHTVGNSSIPRGDFEKWTRWYQEDGNTQVFRLFAGEHNVRNDRGNAARIESFSKMSFSSGWHEWSGRYTIVHPGSGAAIFQSKDNVDHWSVMINMNSDGDITLNRRVGEDEVLARSMTGKSFDLRVRDDGHDYEVYFDGDLAGTGSFERSGKTSFRWGMYVGDSQVTADMMIFVTGAEFE